ncbi:Type IV secretory pathway, VirD2 components (Relaxase) [Sphingomonas sp. EC-HK361]|uniref:relaxase/mobilization nuclease RlxS n=1 Tax=Sphingomonas sp. EC-HK361 TaxID=2038397 RepID=UPI001255DAF8|nr:relaxase/mobilization nuclease RlxS [Sphingomonas sp. EC-HK361]VVT24021.1 Type IV secretory pathway, VirD2 components (Relaxase) [Sphingomonas sp. EC-HK361]
MSDDEDFTPRLGRQRQRSGKKARRYLGRIVGAAIRSAEKGAIRSRRFDGSRIGRGASMGRLLSSRDRFSGLRARRAVVKTRLVRIGAKGMPAARAHLRYIQRDGVTREGAPGELYSAEQDTADGKAFLQRCDGDRHQFRFIVSAEDGSEYPDLKPFTRRLMAQMESDLGTRLDWVAVDHFNTAHPHTHIMLRGVDDTGQNLIIAREYISHGIRERAAELVTLDLGPRTDQEIEARLRHDIGEERMTAIDRRLIRSMDADRLVTSADRDPFQQALRAGRLQKLASLGLAENVGAGRWQLAEDLEATLRTLGERGDIIRTMQRELTARKLERPWLGRSLFGAGETDPEPIVGRVIARGLADEHRDRHYLLVDGVDGHAHYVDIGRGDAVAPIAEGAVVRVSARSLVVRDADRVVAEVAAANGGRYSTDLHLRHDPSATQTFAETHIRRLEAMRRAGAGVDRQPDGSWTIAPDHIDRAAAYEARRHRDQPVDVETLSARPIERLRDADAATWVDRELASQAPLPIRDAGFGREVRSAMTARRQWLVEQQLADIEGTNVRLRANALMLLQRRELLREGDALSSEVGKPFVEARVGERIEGTITRRIDLASGRFAMVEKSREFTLVPWRPVLENQLGKAGSGIMRADGVSWRFGRGRSGPEIT